MMFMRDGHQYLINIDDVNYGKPLRVLFKIFSMQESNQSIALLQQSCRCVSTKNLYLIMIAFVSLHIQGI